MLDVTELVLQDHELLRRRFAAFDDAKGPAALGTLWGELADLLDLHAACEEAVFYPSLLKAATEDGEDETEDAIDDHNKIRDAVRDAAKQEVDSDPWWEAVGRARTENSKHIAEEEREALPDFRKHASSDLREELAVKWTQWHQERMHLKTADTKDKDVDGYIKDNS